MSKKAVIGISCSWIIDSSGPFPGYKRAYVNHDYVRSIYESGGVPLLLPFIDRLEESGLLPSYLDRIDGLLLSGGHDLTPQFYGAEPRQKLGETWHARDIFDRTLLQGALDRGLPIFGICRGFQLINATLGGELVQDLTYSDRELLKHFQGHTPELGTHWVYFDEGNEFFELYGEKVFTNSFHHQVLSKPGEGLLVCGRANDGVIEAVVDPKRKIMATQWHPEMMSGSSPEMKKLFGHFIAKC